MDAVLIDSNLLLLLIVGGTRTTLIKQHSGLSNYSIADYELLREIVGLYDEIVTVPHVLTEVSNLVGFRGNPARTAILSQLARFIVATYELPISSAAASQQHAFKWLGLTDAALLTACGLDDLKVTLLTADGPLMREAQRAGRSLEDFGRWRRQ